MASVRGEMSYPPSVPSVDQAHLLLGLTRTYARARSLVCVTLDFWPNDKCDYGRCPWQNASLLHLDLQHQNLTDAMHALAAAADAPLTLRLGGSLADTIQYNTSETASSTCPPFSVTNATRLGYALKGPCLQLERWQALAGFCQAPRCRIAMGINGLAGRRLASPCALSTDCRHALIPPSCCTGFAGAWDPANALALFRGMRDTNTTPFALEFGNELSGIGGVETSIPVHEYAADVERFAASIASVWPAPAARPKIVAYDSMLDVIYMVQLLKAAPSIDILTTHSYELGPGRDITAAFGKATSVKTLDRMRLLYEAQSAAIFDASGYRASRARPWVGEAGGAFNSGAPTVTDAFVSSFWYLDAMGSAASRGFEGWCRQTLVGGSYGLLRTGDFRPNPDFYAALLFRSVMGGVVLEIKEDPSAPELRAYAHCSARQNGVAMLLLNMGSSALAVEVSDGAAQRGGWLQSYEREVWVGTAADVRASSVRINGVEASGTSLPKGTVVAAGAALSLPPMSYTFLIARGAGTSVCKPSAAL